MGYQNETYNIGHFKNSQLYKFIKLFFLSHLILLLIIIFGYFMINLFNWYLEWNIEWMFISFFQEMTWQKFREISLMLIPIELLIIFYCYMNDYI